MLRLHYETPHSRFGEILRYIKNYFSKDISKTSEVFGICSLKVVALDSQLTTHQLRPSSERTVLARDNPHLFPNIFYSSSNCEAFGSFGSFGSFRSFGSFGSFGSLELAACQGPIER